VTPAGGLTSWLNELAFAPIDYRPDAPRDEWSGDRGCGAQYLSSRPWDGSSPSRDLDGAGLVASGSARAAAAADGRRRRAGGPRLRDHRHLLGYALLEYREWYDFGHVLVLGRVTTGPGGDLISPVPATSSARRA